MKPNTPPVTWNQFCQSYPPFSVAIDGFASGPPSFSKKGPHINFNHHEGVSRLETRATCGQVLMAIKQGLISLFRKAGNPTINIYENHCDEDSSLSNALLSNGQDLGIIHSPALTKLVTAVDLLDATGFMYPFDTTDTILQYIAWIFEPYYNLKLSGGLEKKNEREFSDVVMGVNERVLRYVLGQGETLPLDFRYEKEEGGPGWFFITEIGAQARIKMVGDGVESFVIARQMPEGNWVYAIEAISQFVPFDVSLILSTCNEIEGLTDNEDRWGGSNTRGGSPRVNGSTLSPTSLKEIINNLL